MVSLKLSCKRFDEMNMPPFSEGGYKYQVSNLEVRRQGRMQNCREYLFWPIIVRFVVGTPYSSVYY